MPASFGLGQGEDDPGSADRCGPMDPALTSEQDLYAAWLDLSRVYVVTRLELDRAMQRGAGISLTEGEVMYRLAFAPDHRLRMTDLADRLCMAQSGITRATDKLVERGYVARETRPDNRRTVDAVLTQAGRDAFGRSRQVYTGVIRDRFGRGMAPQDAARLRRVLRDALERIGEAEEVPWACHPVTVRRSA